jgi:hypothetical protein
MRVAFSDPQGSRRWRMLPYAGPVALFVLALLGGFVGPLSGVTAAFTATLAVALFHLVGILPLRQGRMRTADLETGPGYIDLKNAGARSQRIDARAIVGGTTARTGKGILFTLAHSGSGTEDSARSAGGPFRRPRPRPGSGAASSRSSWAPSSAGSASS